MSQQGYCREGPDQTLFIKRSSQDFIIAQVYVDDIIFGESLQAFLNGFIDQMQFKFEICMVNEIVF